MADVAHEQRDVAATPARCFAVASAFEAYPEWTSDVKRVTVLDRDGLGRGTQVEFHVSGLGRRVRYVLQYDYAEAPDAFSWSMVEGDLLRALDGRYAFTPRDGGTRIDYTLRVDVAVPMPGLVKRRASGMIMGNALRDLQRAVEQPTDVETRPEAESVEVVDMATDEPTADEPTAERPMFDPPVFDPPVFDTQVHPDAVPFEQAGTEERPLPPPSVLESVLTELLGAVPEVKDHVLEAADALLDAAKALIDAAERVIGQQRGDE
jgi:hypothetical protein